MSVLLNSKFISKIRALEHLKSNASPYDIKIPTISSMYDGEERYVKTGGRLYLYYKAKGELHRVELDRVGKSNVFQSNVYESIASTTGLVGGVTIVGMDPLDIYNGGGEITHTLTKIYTNVPHVIVVSKSDWPVWAKTVTLASGIVTVIVGVGGQGTATAANFAYTIYVMLS